jgi:hypothetical protein
MASQRLGRTEHMLLSAWGKRWREVQLVMFTAYIDDSGSDPSQPVAHATALVIPGGQLQALERHWQSLQSKGQFGDFHTSVFVARNHKTEFANWSDKQQKKVFLRVRHIIKKFGVKIFSFTVHKKDYDEIVPSDFRKYIGKYHYSWAIRQTVAHLVQWRRSCGMQSPLEFVFDWMKPSDPHRQEIDVVMEQAERVANEFGLVGEYTNYSFRHRKEIPGLQCVDCVAWTCYQYGLLMHRNKPLHPFAEAAWRDFCGHRSSPLKTGGLMDWFSAATIMRDDLQQWVNDELADGKSLARFKAWEQEDANFN